MNDAKSTNKAITFIFVFILFKQTFKSSIWGTRKVYNLHFYFFLFSRILVSRDVSLSVLHLQLIGLAWPVDVLSIFYTYQQQLLHIFFLSHLRQNILFHFISVLFLLTLMLLVAIARPQSNCWVNLCICLHSSHFFHSVNVPNVTPTTFGCACAVLDVVFSRR